MFESLFVLTVLLALHRRLIGARDLIIDSAPILAWRRTDPDAAVGHAPAHHPRTLLQWAVHLYHIRPRVIRLDAGYWGLQLIRWIHAVLGAVAVVPWNPKRQKNRSCLPPSWTAQKLLQADGHRTLLWSGVPLFSSPASAALRMVCCR